MTAPRRNPVMRLRELGADLFRRTSQSRSPDASAMRGAAVPLALRIAASIDQSGDALMLVGPTGVVLHANAAAEHWWRVEQGVLARRRLDTLIVEEDRYALADVIAAGRGVPGVARSAELRLVTDGRTAPRWVELRVTSLYDLADIDLAVVEVVDAMPRRIEAQRIEREHEVLRAVFDSVPMSLFVKDLEGRYVSSNRANLDRYGLSSETEIVGKTADDLAPPDAAEVAKRSDREVVESGRTVFIPASTHLTGPDDRRWYETIKVPLRAADGGITGVLGITSDVTKNKEAEKKLAELAANDALTGLPNRRTLIERLTQAIEAARSARQGLAVIFCDLDFFKAINDIHGHEFGDHLLRQLAAGIRQRLRLGDWIARFGGDEFVVVCHPIAGEIEGYRIASDLLQAVRVPLHINGVSVRVDASVGIAFLRNDHARASDLIRDADAAMYLAKEQGRNRVAMFDDSLHKQTLERSNIDQALRHAIERNEFTLMYQPKVSLRDGKLVGFEALIRWHSQEHGIVSPANFIPLAEETGLILAIGRWALKTACEQLRQWQLEFPGHDDLILAVNVSMRQLFQDAFLDVAREVVDSSGIYPNALELEITETTAMSNPQHAMEILGQLKRLGLRIALDDFGTGYSSLSHLQKLPIDVIKIDRAFVHDIARKRENAEIARLVVAMTQTLGITSVAEGVETRDDMIALRDLGADIAQGYLFSRPLGVQDAADLLRMGTNFIVQ